MNIKLLFGFCGDGVLPFLGDNRQIRVAPTCIPGIVDLGQRQLNKMSNAPADQKSLALQVAVLTFGGSHNLRNRPCDARLFRDNQFQIVFFPP